MKLTTKVLKIHNKANSLFVRKSDPILSKKEKDMVGILWS